MPGPQQIKRSFLRQQGTLNPRPETVRHESFQDSEFFDPQDLVQVKYEMLRQVEVDKQPVSQAAKTFGFSRPSFYQAQAAFQETGLAGLLPHKRGPRSGHKLTNELMEFVANFGWPSLESPVLNWPIESHDVLESRFTRAASTVNCGIKKNFGECSTICRSFRRSRAGYGLRRTTISSSTRMEARTRSRAPYQPRFPLLDGSLQPVACQRRQSIANSGVDCAFHTFRRPEHLYELLGVDGPRKAQGMKLSLRRPATSVMPERLEEVQCEA
jgi:hypothetical protein